MPRPKASPATAVRKTKSFTVKKAASPPTKLPPNPFVSEILDLVSKQRGVAKKVTVLKQYENPALKAILIWNFDESAIYAIPECPVTY